MDIQIVDAVTNSITTDTCWFRAWDADNHLVVQADGTTKTTVTFTNCDWRNIDVDGGGSCFLFSTDNGYTGALSTGGVTFIANTVDDTKGSARYLMASGNTPAFSNGTHWIQGAGGWTLTKGFHEDTLFGAKKANITLTDTGGNLHNN